jgi:hypothetical protein
MTSSKLALLSIIASAAGLKAGATEQITVYHVNPKTYGAAPINMDIADLAGDAFFDLRSKVLPIECAGFNPSNPGRHASDCTNPEVTSDDLVITKLTLEVDSTYGPYAFCNVCVNGSAGISGECSKDGDYVCRCESHGPPSPPGPPGYLCWHGKCFESRYGRESQKDCDANCRHLGSASVDFKTGLRAPSSSLTEFKLAMAHQDQPAPAQGCNNSVGKENITDFFGRMSCRTGSPNWECWRDSVSRKTGGTWYSTLAQGYCGDGTAPAPAGCTWKVTNVDKVINKTCSDQSIYNAIESYGAKNGACFANANCATGLARNTSATCWIDCFYEVLLGPGGGQPGGAITGMPVEILFDAWSKPFESVDPAQGGCPPETDYTLYGTGADRAELRSRGGLYRGTPVGKN